MRSLALLLALTGAVALAGGCNRSETTAGGGAPSAAPPAVEAAPPAAATVRVTALRLGTDVGPDKKVTAPKETFAPGDTIYASVESVGGSPGTTLTARWTYEDGQLVNEASQSVPASGPATTEFHVSKPSGWPEGRYTLEIHAAGTRLASRDFEVR
jgi:hypothetical protein